MKILSLVLVTAVAAVIGSAPLRAQSSENTPQSDTEMKAPTHPGPNEWQRDRDWYSRPGWSRGGYGWMGPWMMGPRAGQMGPRAGWRRYHRHHGRRGAHFTFTRGDARIDIQCPANQSLKDCVDAASTLIDKVKGMGPPPPPPPGQPKPPALQQAPQPPAGGNGPAAPPDRT